MKKTYFVIRKRRRGDSCEKEKSFYR